MRKTEWLLEIFSVVIVMIISATTILVINYNISLSKMKKIEAALSSCNIKEYTLVPISDEVYKVLSPSFSEGDECYLFLQHNAPQKIMLGNTVLWDKKEGSKIRIYDSP